MRRSLRLSITSAPRRPRGARRKIINWEEEEEEEEAALSSPMGETNAKRKSRCHHRHLHHC